MLRGDFGLQWTCETGVPNYQRYCRRHDPRYPADGPLWKYMPEAKVSLCPTFTTLAKTMGVRHPGHDPSVPIVPYLQPQADLSTAEFGKYEVFSYPKKGRPPGL